MSKVPSSYVANSEPVFITSEPYLPYASEPCILAPDQQPCILAPDQQRWTAQSGFAPNANVAYASDSYTLTSEQQFRTTQASSPSIGNVLHASEPYRLAPTTTASSRVNLFTRPDTLAHDPTKYYQLHRPVKQEQKVFARGARVEAYFEGNWYQGTVKQLPETDPENMSRYGVQCDVDDNGLLTWVTKLRELCGPAENAIEMVDIEGIQVRSDVDVVVCQAFMKGGDECFVVNTVDGDELGYFGSRHLDFHLRAKAEQLRNWLDDLPTPLLPGILALLVKQVSQLGPRLKEAETRRSAQYAPEDYQFFGLNEESSDQDVEKAYRRLSVRLHPDKGGDEAAFAAMRQRYNRIKMLRSCTPNICRKEKNKQNNEEGNDEAEGSDPNIDGGTAGNDNEDEARAAGESEGGAIRWDPKNRDSMLKAHEDLHLQLVWITKQLQKIDKEIEDLQRRQNIRYCLEDHDGQVQ